MKLGLENGQEQGMTPSDQDNTHILQETWRDAAPEPWMSSFALPPPAL